MNDPDQKPCNHDEVMTLVYQHREKSSLGYYNTVFPNILEEEIVEKKSKLYVWLSRNPEFLVIYVIDDYLCNLPTSTIELELEGRAMNVVSANLNGPLIPWIKSNPNSLTFNLSLKISKPLKEKISHVFDVLFQQYKIDNLLSRRKLVYILLQLN